MPVPTSYTESQLKDYMLSVTSRVATAIQDWTASNFAEAVTDTLIAYGVDDIADAEEIGKLRGLARVFAWQAMVEATAAQFDSSTDTGQSTVYQKYSSLHAQARAAHEMAKAEAVRLGYIPPESEANEDSYTIQIGQLVHDDAYSRESTSEEYA